MSVRCHADILGSRKSLWMLAEGTKHLKVPVGQGFGYASFREDRIRFGSTVELSFKINAENS